jgi:hypothetical protein
MLRSRGWRGTAGPPGHPEGPGGGGWMGGIVGVAVLADGRPVSQCQNAEKMLLIAILPQTT